MIEVIGAGFGRTGTDSLRAALGILGFGPCHHMLEVITRPEQRRLWRAFVRGAPIGWDELLAGYRSCVDWPTAYYWRELVQVYPSAKVVLSYRPPEQWWTSFERTILPGILSGSAEQVGIALIRNKVFGGRPEDRAHAIACYEANVRDVEASVPAERLLVHEPREGWEPLCAHLGVSVPAEPYPHRNTTQEFVARRRNTPRPT